MIKQCHNGEKCKKGVQMNEINNLAYFLDSVKEAIPFTDKKDFEKKISQSKEFRVRIQKLVYLSKFFGWDNTFIFTLHQHGPYSVNLAIAYNENNFFNEKPEIIKDLDLETFLKFIYAKNIEFLETSSTLIYYFKDKIEMFDEKNSIKILKKLKPHLSENIIVNAYAEITKFNILTNFKNATDKHLTLNKLELQKNKLNKDLVELIDITESNEMSRNRVILSGSLEYMRVVLRIENLENIAKKDLLDFIRVYLTAVEEIINKNDGHLEDKNIEMPEKLFNQFENYVSKELDIIPKMDEEQFHYANYY